MVFLFLQKFLIFLFYYVGVTAFVAYLYFNYVIYLLEQNFIFNSLSPPPSAIKPSYDIIIVGGGTAGLTIAAGLESQSVLIIEAGNDFQQPKSPLSSTLAAIVNNIPIITPLLQLQELFDWQYKTQPQKYACKSLTNSVSHWPMGRGFGGTQLINNMIYDRGHQYDYHYWFGTSEHEYNYTKDVLPYFKEFEDFVELSDLRSTTRLYDAYFQTQLFIPFDEVALFTYRRPKVMQYNGRRWSVADSYYRQNHSLHQIIVNAKVERILFDNDATDTTTAQTTMKAVGISYRKYGRVHEVRATKAVILSSGTIGSPTILLKSGIGPEGLYTHGVNKSQKDTSRKNLLKIELRKNLPAVGEHLQDHVTTGMDLIKLNQTLGLEPWNLYTLNNLFNYFWNGHGPLTMTGCEGLGFIRSKFAKYGKDEHILDLGFMVIPMGSTIDAGVYFRRFLNINERTWQEYFQPLIATPTISILPIVLHPKSRGFVSIRMSKDDEIETVIQPNYLSHPDDIDVLVAGLRIITKLIDTPPFKSIGASIPKRKIPGCQDMEFGSNEYWRCYAQHLTFTAYHPVGTCRMGKNQSDSVIDPLTFQVHGIEHLYVCDASVMPSMPSANPQAAVGMLAKKFLHSFKRRV